MFCDLTGIGRQSEVPIDIRMNQLPNYDSRRQEPIVPSHRALQLSHLWPAVLQISMRIAAMPSFLDDMNLRQGAHYRMTFRILLGAPVEISDNVLGGERAEHHRNPGSEILGKHCYRAREARLVPWNPAALDRFAEHHRMPALVGHFDLHPEELGVVRADID